ncbi:esterase [Nocardioides sp. dk4132]|uniref:patatin-like phospholipase family protein n=1 Tax=unclassified Nocardioides TaxID=2615069 RepID=UPI0012960B2F|nr:MULTISPECIES: patatin-like phospholipase family protein [unclassified Nocardioides]MQW75753.1 esterase [Nocardioides sp. dk4132]QGA08635.1 esterase [Nocardioides sp. dk884]
MATRVALALGSGGARGYAHIGAVRAVQERDCEIVAVAGTSMGALVGGLASAGRLEEFADWATSLQWRDVLRLLDPKLASPGVLAADRLLDAIQEIFSDVQIEDLPVPFTAVATDLAARREVWFQRGPLRAAVRASIAIPGVFTPVMINGRLLVDGGLTNPVPIDPTVGVASDLTVAVSLTGPRRRVRDHVAPTQESAAPQRFEEWRSRLRRTVVGITGREDRDQELVPQPVRTSWGTDELPAELTMRDVTAQSFEAMQGVVARYRMAAVPADVVVTVPVDSCRSLDFHRAEELIELGYRLTSDALDAAGVEADPLR